jgi:hypothetical protein
VSGKQIKRYRPWVWDQFVIYTNRDTLIDKYPNVGNYLKSLRHLNTCKEVQQKKHPWWCLHRARNPEIFRSPKFIGLTTTKTIDLIYDADDSIYVTDAMYLFSLLPEYDPWTCLAVLQSKTFLFLYRVANQGESRVIPQIKASKLQSLPFPKYQPSKPVWVEVGKCCKHMLQLHKQLAAAKTPHDQTVLQGQIAATDRQIDRLVYELYGLTEEEIRIAEGEAAE